MRTIDAHYDFINGRSRKHMYKISEKNFERLRFVRDKEHIVIEHEE